MKFHVALKERYSSPTHEYKLNWSPVSWLISNILCTLTILCTFICKAAGGEIEDKIPSIPFILGVHGVGQITWFVCSNLVSLCNQWTFFIIQSLVEVFASMKQNGKVVKVAEWDLLGDPVMNPNSAIERNLLKQCVCGGGVIIFVFGNMYMFYQVMPNFRRLFFI